MNSHPETDTLMATGLQLVNNSPSCTDTAMIRTFIAASGIQAAIPKGVFGSLLHCWMYHKSAVISYRGLKDLEATERKINPYAIICYHFRWYLKSYCHLRNDVRTFAIQRIKSAEALEETFEVPPEFAKAPPGGSPFEFDPVRDVDIWCSPEIAPFICDKLEFYIQKYASQNDDGSVTFHIERASRQAVINWVLAQEGRAKVIKPRELAGLIESADRIYRNI